MSRSRSALPRIRRDVAGARFLAYVPKDVTPAGGETPAIVLPADGVDTLGDEALAELETQAVAAFEAIRDMEFPSDEDVAEAERLAEVVVAVRTEQSGRVEAAEERRAKLSGLGDTLAPVEDDTDADEEPVDVPDDASSITDEEPAEQPREAVTASGRPQGGATARPRVRASELGARQAKPAAPTRNPVTLTAAADVPGVQPGAQFTSIMDVAEAVARRASEYPTSSFPGEQRVKMRNGVAVLRKDFEDGLIAKAVTDSHVLDYAIDQHRLPGGSLVAAGGWCAPSETLYDLAEIEAADGLLDLPEIQVNRGGIRFTPGPDFRSIFDGTGFAQTEAQAIANTTKPCYNVPCPPFTEERAGIQGLCITAGILQNRAYPELTARVIRGALAAHAHRISAASVARLVALSTAVATSAPWGSGAATPVLNAIELAVEDVKYRHRMSRPSTLEAVFPAWTFAAIRADLAYRQGDVDVLTITDEQVMSWFRQRKIVPQFIYDWQDTAIGQATAAARWPATLQFLIYPAGTFVRGLGDVITLDTVYDSAGLTQNQFTGLFTEESLLVAKTGHDSRLYTVPIAANGWTNSGYAVPTAPVSTPTSGI